MHIIYVGIRNASVIHYNESKIGTTLVNYRLLSSIYLYLFFISLILNT